MNGTIKLNVNELYKNIIYRKSLLESFVSILIGLFVGAYIFKIADLSFKEKIIDYFVSFHTDITDKSAVEVFSGIVLCGLVYFAVMFICGGNIFGKEISMIFTMIKASGIGTLVSFFYKQYGAEGFEYVLLVLLPGKIFMFLAMLSIGEICIDISTDLRHGHNQNSKKILKIYSVKNVISLGLMLISWFIDCICLLHLSNIINFQ